MALFLSNHTFWLEPVCERPYIITPLPQTPAGGVKLPVLTCRPVQGDL